MPKHKQKRSVHCMIPDCQVRPGVSLDHLTALGNYLVDRKPDVIVQIGDFADMKGLSSYEKGKKSGLGQNYQQDLAAAREGMEKLLSPIDAHNRTLTWRKRYKPRLVLTLGNHCARITRYVECNPELSGKVSLDDLPYERWEVHPFLEVVDIDGISYSHYFVRNSQGRVMQTRRGAPNARLQVQRELKSCTAGHLQGLDFAIHQTENRRYYGLIAGSFYSQEEDYLSPQGTAYWRGIIMKHEVENGEYDIMTVSLRYLLENWL